MSESLEQRINTAREANLALYLAEPSSKSAQLLVSFEKTVERLRREQPQPSEGGYPSATATATVGGEISYNWP